MSLNIPDYLMTATQVYYGVDVSTDTTSQLWTEFCAKLNDTQKDYLTLAESTNTPDVQAAVSDFVQKAIQNLREQGTLPDLTDSDVNALISTLAGKLVALNGQPQLSGLMSSDPTIIENTLMSAWSDPSLSTALTTLLTQTAATISVTGAAIPSQYIDFLSDKIGALQQSEATVAISPHEQEIRRIMFEVFSLALDMMHVLQTTNQLEANLLYYYTNLQQEYINMMSKIQMYGPNPVEFIVANSANFGDTKLGYANITVQDIANYLYNQIANTQGATSVSYSTVDTANDPNAGGHAPLLFTLVRNANNGFAFIISAYNSGVTTDYGYGAGYVPILSTEKLSADGNNYSATNADNPNSWYSLSTNLGGTEQTVALINALMSHLTKQWNATPDTTTLADVNPTLSLPNTNLMYYPAISSNTTDNTVYSIASFGALKAAWSVQNEAIPTAGTTNVNPTQVYFTGPAAIAWEDTMHGPYGTSDQNKTDQTNAASRASDFRTQENALLQTYIQSASSLKDMAADAGKRVDTAMTQVHQSLQNQSDLCDAIVNSLRGLIAAIFNR